MNGPALTLRDYQVEAVEAALGADAQRSAIVMPTGGGKTAVIAGVVRRHFEQARGRSLVVAHRIELIEQNARTIRRFAPDLRVGIVKAERDQTGHDVISASVQTLVSAARRGRIRDVGLVVVDECFPAGTRVGDVPIEDLRPGDLVPSWDEATGEQVWRPVVALMRRKPERLVRVEFDDGRTVWCTPNHPFMTSSGWRPAGMLSRGACVLSFAHDAAAEFNTSVRGVRGTCDTQGSAEVPLRCMAEERSGVLLGPLPGHMGEQGFRSADGAHESAVRIGSDADPQPDGTSGGARKDGRHLARRPASPEGSGRQRQGDSRTATTFSGVPGLADGAGRGAEGRGSSVPLQDGHSPSDDDGVRRGGRGVSLAAGPPRIGPQTGSTARFARVVDVQVLELGSDATYGGVCPDGAVYNIEVEDTHTYLVNGGIVVHNCHHAAADSYMRVLGHFGCFTDGGARALGLTATLERGDDKALGDVWQDVVYSKSIAWMIEHGWLVRPRGLRVRVPDLDLRKVRKTRGDFSDSSLGEAIEGSLAPELVAKAYAEHASGKQGILFAPTVHTAELYRDALCELGITAELVHGAMAEGDRRRTLRRFEDGAIQVLCNCMVLTEGTDLPMAEVCVIGRPTLNRGLLIQMAGRVLRLHPGKDSALIIDVSGATERHSLLGAIELFGQESVHVPVEGEVPESEQPADDVLVDLTGIATELDREIDEGPTWLTGPTEVVEVDLFHGSKSMWQRTQGGIWFINATSGKDNSRYIIVQRAVRPGAWDVIEMDAKTRGRSSWVATDVDDLSFAMAFAEANVTDGERMTARKNARWRKDRPSDAQAELAVRMGIRGSVAEVMMMMTKGEVAAALDHRFASRRIDPYVPAHARRAA